MRFQVLPKLLGIHVISAFVDIHEIGPRPGLGDRLRRGDERVRDRDGDGPFPEARRHQRESHRVRAAGHAHAMLRAAESCKLPLEAFDHGAAHKSAGPQGLRKNRLQLFLQLRMGSR